MKGIRALKYLPVLVLPTAGVLALTRTGWWTFLPLIIAFGIIPLLEFFTPTDNANLSKAEEEVAKKDRFYDLLLYLVLPAHYGLLVLFLFTVNEPGLTQWDIVGRVLAMGISCGVLGINVAHELGHRRKPYEKTMAKALLLTSLYMHFYIEHNKGHHRWVSTERDPASARYGEWLYAFWFRSVIFSWLSAWKIERDRLRKTGKPVASPVENQMLQFQLLQVALVVGIGLVFSWWVALAFVAAAVIGFLLLETVNYIEHYGLQRKKINEKRYERTLPVHSWNSDHLLGRLFLFELTRHSDHHYMPGRKYQVLRHHDAAPQMPFGYPAMMVLAFVPPLFFAVVHPVIARVKAESPQGAALA